MPNRETIQITLTHQEALAFVNAAAVGTMMAYRRLGGEIDYALLADTVDSAAIDLQKLTVPSWNALIERLGRELVAAFPDTPIEMQDSSGTDFGITPPEGLVS